MTQAARASSIYVPITSVSVSAFRIPTKTPESDGTLEWQATILVVAEIAAGGKTGFGYTYASSRHALSPDFSALGFGLELKRRDAQRFAI